MDCSRAASAIERFIAEELEGSGLGGVAFGLSGGVDSAVTAHLCARAVGADRCLAIMMPNRNITPPSETDDGVLVAEGLGIPYKITDITGISDLVSGGTENAKGGHRTTGNLNARLRAAVLYHEAQKQNLLVAGTDDRSERLIGYFTKYGDGACDILPIGNVYKTQVWELAEFLGVPRHITRKRPSAHLWPGHDAAREIGMDYQTIDRILEHLESGTLDMLHGVVRHDIERVLQLHRSTAHKRSLPPMPDMGGC